MLSRGDGQLKGGTAVHRTGKIIIGFCGIVQDHADPFTFKSGAHGDAGPVKGPASLRCSNVPTVELYGVSRDRNGGFGRGRNTCGARRAGSRRRDRSCSRGYGSGDRGGGAYLERWLGRGRLIVGPAGGQAYKQTRQQADGGYFRQAQGNASFQFAGTKTAPRKMVPQGRIFIAA